MKIMRIITAAGLMALLFCAGAAAEDEKIAVEKTGDAPNQAEGMPQLAMSTLEAEFDGLAGSFAQDVSFEIESVSSDTAETISRRAKIFVKDTATVRIETSLPGGIELIVTHAGGEGWIYFPKTNMIMELKNAGSKLAEKAGGDFLAGFAANRAGHVINKTECADGSRRYEIADKSARKVVSYDFSKDEIPQRITVVEKNRSSEEILIKKTAFGPVDESLFARPKNAFKMPVNEFPDFDY
jgi:outer membrane lipoprotein-sorting protein